MQEEVTLLDIIKAPVRYATAPDARRGINQINLGDVGYEDAHYEARFLLNGSNPKAMDAGLPIEKRFLLK